MTTDPTLWTGKRCEELSKLRLLLYKLIMMNKSSSFIQNFEQIEELATELNNSHTDKSFIEFLEDNAIASRSQYRERTGELPK